jgi:hypothetical protein
MSDKICTLTFLMCLVRDMRYAGWDDRQSGSSDPLLIRDSWLDIPGRKLCKN